MSIDRNKVTIHTEVTRLFLDRVINHEQRVRILKANGITGEENIDLDNAFEEERVSRVAANSAPFVPNDSDQADFDGESQ